MQSQTFLLVQDESVGVSIPTPPTGMSQSILSPSFPLVEGGGVGLPTLPTTMSPSVLSPSFPSVLSGAGSV